MKTVPFHHCHASVTTDYHDGLTGEFYDILFTSYQTPVLGICGQTITVGCAYRYSNTTISQVSRFLRENNLPSYMDIKAEFQRLEKSGVYFSDCSFDIDGYHIQGADASDNGGLFKLRGATTWGFVA